jgi:hypothetical protein
MVSIDSLTSSQTSQHFSRLLKMLVQAMISIASLMLIQRMNRVDEYAVALFLQIVDVDNVFMDSF